MTGEKRELVTHYTMKEAFLELSIAPLPLVCRTLKPNLSASPQPLAPSPVLLARKRTNGSCSGVG